MGKEESLQPMTLGQQGIHMQTSEVEPLLHNLQKN